MTSEYAKLLKHGYMLRYWLTDDLAVVAESPTPIDVRLLD